MKKCDWCGKEYPDLATACIEDGRPLSLISDNQPQRETTPNAHGRPTAITVICCWGFLSGGFALSMALSFGKRLYQVNSDYPVLVTVSGVLTLVAMYGLFKMRKWGLHMYTVLCAVNQFYGFAMGRPFYLSLVVQCVVIGIGFAHYRKLR